MSAQKKRPHFSSLTTVAIEAALKAGALLQNGFGTSFQISKKPGIQNYVTEYDHASEKSILETIRLHFPEHDFLCEESGSIRSKKKAEILWIVDPLDGTTNFAHHIPIFSISIAAVSKQGILSGVIYQPLSRELFVAEQGQGAYLNGEKIKVSNRAQFAGGIGATGFPQNIRENPMHCIDHFVGFLKQNTVIRNLGSAAVNLAYVAAGCFDAYWSVGLYSWDAAAGILLVEEAGGKVTDYNGKNYPVIEGGPIVVSNGVIHQEVLDGLHKFRID
jgi:myo-inositol-1(or 4)-monophosphatase